MENVGKVYGVKERLNEKIKLVFRIKTKRFFNFHIFLHT